MSLPPSDPLLASAYARWAASVPEPSGRAPAPPLGALAPQVRRRRLLGPRPWAAAAAAALLGVGAWALAPVPPEARAPTEAAPRAWYALGPGLAVAPEDPAPGGPSAVPSGGPRVSASAPAELLLGGRVRVVLDGGARLRLLDPASVALEAGRAWFEVEPGPFQVRTPAGTVAVLGTRFEVDLRAGLAVDVLEGQVSAAGHGVGAGQRLTLDQVEPRHGPAPAWFLAPPRLLLEGPAWASAGEVIHLRLVFENLSQVRQTLAGPAAVASGALLSLTAPDGGVQTRPLDLGGALAGALAPGHPLTLRPSERRVVTLPFQVPAGSPGRWRLSALYRPEGGAPLASPSFPLGVR